MSKVEKILAKLYLIVALIIITLLPALGPIFWVFIILMLIESKTDFDSRNFSSKYFFIFYTGIMLFAIILEIFQCVLYYYLGFFEV